MSAYIYSELLHAEPSDNEMGTPGYRIEKGDGIYWEPKEIFERHALKVEDNPKLPSGVSIGPSMVDNFIKEVHSITMGDRTTWSMALRSQKVLPAQILRTIARRWENPSM